MFLLTLLVLLFGLQATLLDLFLLEFWGYVCIPFAVLDLLLLIHMCVNYSNDYAATNGAFQWIWYTWLLIAKIALFYWFTFSDSQNADILRIETLLGAYGFYIFMFATAMLYPLWMLRAAYQLYGSPSKVVNVESLVHNDIILHVMLDLIDAMVAFSFVQDRDYLSAADGWLFNLTGVFCIITLFMHSYSFPTGASTKMMDASRRKSAALEIMQESDIFLTRKHVALVSIFLVDIPFLIFRAYIWIRYPETPGFIGYIAKNIINIPLSIFRLNQCRVAEKDATRSLGKEVLTADAYKQSVDSEVSEMVPRKNQGMEIDRGSGRYDVSRDSDLRRHKRDLSDRFNIARYSHDSQATESNLHPADLQDENLEMEPTVFVPDKFFTRSLDLQKLIGELQYSRQLPVKGFSPGKVFAKITHVVSCGIRHSMASRLDSSLLLPYWRQVTLALPLVVYWATHIVIVAFFFHPLDTSRGTADLVQIGSYNEHVAVIGATAGTGFLLFLLFATAAPFLDVIFSTLFWCVRVFSFWLNFVIVRDTGVFDIAALLKNGLNINVPNPVVLEEVLLWSFALPFIISFLSSLFYVQSAFLNRKYCVFVLQPPNRAARRLTSDTTDDAGPRTDEAGWVATSSILCFYNCKYQLCPISMHELIIGPDMIKGIRLSDVLLTRDWKVFFFLFTLKALTLTRYIDITTVSVFAAHLVLCVIYLTFAQTIRLLSLRRFEIKVLFEEIIAEWSIKQSEQMAQRPPTVERGDLISVDGVKGRKISRAKYITLLDIVDRYKMQGFFTSPGDIWPPLA